VGGGGGGGGVFGGVGGGGVDLVLLVRQGLGSEAQTSSNALPAAKGHG